MSNKKDESRAKTKKILMIDRNKNEMRTFSYTKITTNLRLVLFLLGIYSSPYPATKKYYPSMDYRERGSHVPCTSCVLYTGYLGRESNRLNKRMNHTQE